MLRMFDFKCNRCGKVFERIVNDGESPMCLCGGSMTKLPPIFSVNMGPVPISGYYDDNLGTFIRTKEHRKQVMREQGVTEHGATPKEGQAWA